MSFVIDGRVVARRWARCSFLGVAYSKFGAGAHLRFSSEGGSVLFEVRVSQSDAEAFLAEHERLGLASMWTLVERPSLVGSGSVAQGGSVQITQSL